MWFDCGHNNGHGLIDTQFQIYGKRNKWRARNLSVEGFAEVHFFTVHSGRCFMRNVSFIQADAMSKISHCQGLGWNGRLGVH